MPDCPEPNGYLVPAYRLREGDATRLRRVHNLSTRALLVLDALVSFDLPHTARDGRKYRKGVVWPHVATLAACVGYSERTVQRGLAELVKARLVQRIVRGRRRPAYYVLDWLRLVPDGPGRKGDKVVPGQAAQRVTRPARPYEAVESKETPARRQALPSALEDRVIAPPGYVREALQGVVRRVQPPQAESAPNLPARMTDRVAREAWLAEQQATRKALGFG